MDSRLLVLGDEVTEYERVFTLCRVNYGEVDSGLDALFLALKAPNVGEKQRSNNCITPLPLELLASKVQSEIVTDRR